MSHFGKIKTDVGDSGDLVKRSVTLNQTNFCHLGEIGKFLANCCLTKFGEIFKDLGEIQFVVTWKNDV